MVAGHNIDSNTKGWQHQAATLLMTTAPATETKTPRQRSYNNEKVQQLTCGVKHGDGNIDSNVKHLALLMITVPDTVQITTKNYNHENS